VLLLALVLAGSGCGADAAVAGAPVFEGEPAARLASASGRLAASVWTWPSPPVKGTNALRFEVVDGAAAPVSASAATATTWMPAHGHSTSVKPAVTPGPDGTYEVAPVVLFMAGRWNVRLDLTDAGGTVDELVAAIDVR
jgi:hypothetical protein